MRAKVVVRAKFTLLPYNLYHKPSLVGCRCSVCRCLLVAHMHAYARKACFVRSYPTRSCISMPDPYLQGVRGTASTHLTARRPHILVVCCRSYHQQTPHYRSCAYERSVHSQGTMGTLGDSTSRRIAAVIKSSAAAAVPWTWPTSGWRRKVLWWLPGTYGWHMVQEANRPR